MKNFFLPFFIAFLPLSHFGQVGINTVTPNASLDVVAKNPTGSTTNVDGILVPRVDRERAQSMTSISNSTLIFVNSIATGTATGIASNITSIGFYFFDTVVLPAPGKWVKLQSTSSGWNITGNTGTNATTDYIGTNDATDLVFKTNAGEKFRIANSSGDISVGNAATITGTIKTQKELVMRQDNDQFGSSILRLRNRNAENGAIYETSGGPALVDFIFKTASNQSNIRYETRNNGEKFTSTNTTEWQFGVAGSPTFTVGSGTTVDSNFRRGNLGIATALPTSTLHNSGTTAFTTATTGTANTILLLNAGTFAPPAAASFTGRVYIIRNTSTTADTVVNSIINYSAATAANFNLTPAIGSIMIVSNGTSWFRID